MALQPDELVMLQGKPHPLYRGVLREAHEKGLLSLEVTILQFPDAANGGTAVCQATATFPGTEGRDLIFTEIGDADDSNTNPMIRKHKIRMAATRAKGRALRDALGIGDALVEEMGGNASEDDVGTERQGRPVHGDAKPGTGKGHGSGAVADRHAGAAPVAPDDPDVALARVVEQLYPPIGEAVCAAKGCGSVLTLEELTDSAREKLRRPCCAEHLLTVLKKNVATAETA